MKTRTMLFLVALVLGGFGTGGVATSFAQDDDVRGAFLTTRPKPAEKSNSSGGFDHAGNGGVCGVNTKPTASHMTVAVAATVVG